MTTAQKCSNSEPGTFNHECGKPASVTVRYRVTEADIAPYAYGIAPGDEFTVHYCPRCWHNGTEAQRAKRLSVAVEGVA